MGVLARVVVAVAVVDLTEKNMAVPTKERLSTRPFLILSKNGTLLVCVVNPNISFA